MIPEWYPSDTRVIPEWSPSNNRIGTRVPAISVQVGMENAGTANIIGPKKSLFSNTYKLFHFFKIIIWVSEDKVPLIVRAALENYPEDKEIKKTKYVLSKWFQPRNINSLSSVIVLVVSVVRKRTAGDSDWRFDNLSGSHLKSHCDIVPSLDGIYAAGHWPDWSIKLLCYWL